MLGWTDRLLAVPFSSLQRSRVILWVPHLLFLAPLRHPISSGFSYFLGKILHYLAFPKARIQWNRHVVCSEIGFIAQRINDCQRLAGEICTSHSIRCMAPETFVTQGIDDKVQQRARVDLLHARQLLGRAEARAPVGDGGRREAEVQHVQGRDVGARAAGLRDDALDDGVVRVGVAVVGGAVAAGGLAPEDDVVRVAAEGRDVVAGPFDAVFVVWSVK